MAEFVEKRCQEMIPVLEQMEKLKLFDGNEIQNIAEKFKEYEYKIQRYTKCKEDYLRYIQYEMDLLKLIKQRKDKYGITQKKTDIDFAIVNKMNNLYKEAISKFQDDIRFWIAYMKFCKHMHFHSNVTDMLSRMLQVHRDKPKCWHIAACWELEENNNKQSARQYLFRGLKIHPNSQLLYIDAFKLELNDHLTITSNNFNDTESHRDNSASAVMNDSEMPVALEAAYFIYRQAFEYIKDIKFIIELLNITKKYKDTDRLQKKIICDMIQEYTHESLILECTHEPLIWDIMARRKLQGLVQPGLSDIPMEVENVKQTSLKDRIASCNEIYQMALKKIKTEEMWSLYIDCLLEINNHLESLPNFKKLLKTALIQAHQAKKLNEKYYLSWIDLLNVDKENDESTLKEATDIWHMRLNYLLRCGQEKKAYALYPKLTQLLGEKALPLWKLRILHAQIRSSDEVEESFQAALKYPLIAKDIKFEWLEWLVLTKGIDVARETYSLCLQPPTTLEFYKKIVMLELVQPEISLEYMRQLYDMAIPQFGTNNTSVWLDYMKFEMKHGDPKNVNSIHERAVKMLDPSLVNSFIEDYNLIVAKPDAIQ
ncbi:U3 small nucleolar RNA-associated protein 6 homolog [Pogonomyrmex barbatus]|uniref:U3 small nucleolar RNA-associated protein 6 homolog n=1 Tax=Pogonomyrmex barbatus TaxID=144034 RepID=A0A6I9WQY7_9HYME|nr:U3 small nucleolar RNA-associated protein 6 homolog [Pogonomyrmex barbatus]